LRKGYEMAFLKILLVVVVLVAIAFLGLATTILFKKKGKFPNIHIGSNKHLKERGITCAQTFDKLEQSKVKKQFSFKGIGGLEDFKGGC